MIHKWMFSNDGLKFANHIWRITLHVRRSMYSRTNLETLKRFNQEQPKI